MSKQGVQFRLKTIELLAKEMQSPLQAPLTDNVKFHFAIQVEMKVHEQLKAVLPVVSVTIRNSDNTIDLATIAVSLIFEIVDFAEHIQKNEEGIYNVPDDLEYSLRPIAISTARGIMFSEFRGTYLHNAILPVVYFDPKQEEVK